MQETSGHASFPVDLPDQNSRSSRGSNYKRRPCDRKNHQGSPLSVFQTEQYFMHVSSHEEQEETKYAEEHQIEEERLSLRQSAPDFNQNGCDDHVAKQLVELIRMAADSVNRREALLILICN